MSQAAESRIAKSVTALACAIAFALLVLAIVGSVFMWRRYAAQRALDDFRAEALESSAFPKGAPRMTPPPVAR